MVNSVWVWHQTWSTKNYEVIKMVERLELFAECQAEKAEKLRTFSGIKLLHIKKTGWKIIVSYMRLLFFCRLYKTWYFSHRRDVKNGWMDNSRKN